MERDSAVSPVLSETLLIALVLILVPIVTISLMNQLPEDRVPTVTIIGEKNSDSLSFHHKGGDYIKKGDIRLIIRSQGSSGNKEAEYNGNDFDITWKGKKGEIYDVGSILTINESEIKNEIEFSEINEVRFIAKNSVVYVYQV